MVDLNDRSDNLGMIAWPPILILTDDDFSGHNVTEIIFQWNWNPQTKPHAESVVPNLSTWLKRILGHLFLLMFILFGIQIKEHFNATMSDASGCYIRDWNVKKTPEVLKNRYIKFVIEFFTLARTYRSLYQNAATYILWI